VMCVYFVDSAILDESNIQQLGEELFAMTTKPNLKMLLNFEKVDYLSSAVLGKLVALHKKIVKEKGGLKFCCIKDSILEVFKVTKLDKIFDIHTAEQKALENFKNLRFWEKK
ncbi:MAG: STAS domain-containing protein, partial [Planctomycetota bacterium]